jgi:hypothetical protein
VVPWRELCLPWRIRTTRRDRAKPCPRNSDDCCSQAGKPWVRHTRPCETRPWALLFPGLAQPQFSRQPFTTVVT